MKELNLKKILNKWLRTHDEDCKECDFEIEHAEKLIRAWAVAKLPKKWTRVMYTGDKDKKQAFNKAITQAKEALEGKDERKKH